jgi:RecA/RadA recombinase
MATAKKTPAAKKAPAKAATAAKKAPAKTKVSKVADDVLAAIEEAVGTNAKAAKFDVRSFYRQTVDDVSRRQGVDSDPMEDLAPMSTGWLALDLMYGGGIRPAMYTHSGDEQTAKTTLALSEMVQAINLDIPLIAFWDYEGSTKNSKPYLRSILKTMGAKIKVQEVFGKKDQETGKWVIPPRVQYYPETVAEKFFDWLAAIERSYPDKKFVANKWWLIYEDNKANKAMLGDAPDPKMPKKDGKGLWVEAPDGNLQGFVIVDSWAAMNPTANDDEDTDNSLAGQARMFSKQLLRIKGRMGKKLIALVGMNQLSDIPMAMYGPKQQEKGGKALRFYSDVRIWNTARGSGMPFNPVFDKEEGMEIEKSVEGEGRDAYRYILSKNVKNKLWTPKRKAWFRIWAENYEGNGCGFDPFFDTMVYLRETGQMAGNERKKLRLNIDGHGEAKKPANWMQLKTWVLGTKEQKIAVCKDLGFAKPFDLRAHCFKQMEAGKSETLYVAKRNAGKVEEAE